MGKDSEITEFGLDETISHTGSISAYISNNSPETIPSILEDIPVKGDTFYKFSCWIKTEDVLEDSKGANLSVLNTLTTSRSVTGTSKNWEYVELYGKTSPDQNIVSLSLALGGHGSLSSGKAWFDTVEAVEIDEVPAGEIALNLDPNNLSLLMIQMKVVITLCLKFS